MSIYRYIFAAFALFTIIPAPVKAQIFWLPPTFASAPLVGYEAGMGVALPGANQTEQQAAILWSMRSGLNVAALQCGFQPTLRTVENYNALLNNHSEEMLSAFNTLGAYFKRTSKTPAAGQKALDTYGTRTYSGYSTVAAQRGFCTTAGKIGRIALFTPRGHFTEMAVINLRELRSSLKLAGEQQFRFPIPYVATRLPKFNDNCWNGMNYNRSCGWQ